MARGDFSISRLSHDTGGPHVPGRLDQSVCQATGLVLLALRGCNLIVSVINIFPVPDMDYHYRFLLQIQGVENAIIAVAIPVKSGKLSCKGLAKLKRIIHEICADPRNDLPGSRFVEFRKILPDIFVPSYFKGQVSFPGPSCSDILRFSY